MKIERIDSMAGNPDYKITVLMAKINTLIEWRNQMVDKPKEKFVPKEDEIYFYVNSTIEIESTFFDEDYSLDQQRKLSKNIFKTKEEAENARDKIKDLLSNL